MKPCSVDGCTNTLSAYNVTGMCGWHSVRAEKGLPLDPCSVADCQNFDAEAVIVDRKCSVHKTNPDSHLANYTPNDPVCPVCKKAVEPQHSPYRDTVSGAIGHDYCLRTETTESRAARFKTAIANGMQPTFPLRWA